MKSNKSNNSKSLSKVTKISKTTKISRLRKGVYYQYRNLIQDLKNVNSFKSLFKVSLKHKYKLIAFIALCIILLGILKYRTKEAVGNLSKDATMNVLQTLSEQSDSNGLVLKIIYNLKNISSSKELKEIGETLGNILDKLRHLFLTDMFKSNPDDKRTPKERADDVNVKLNLVKDIVGQLVDKKGGKTILEQFREVQKALPTFLGGDENIKVIGNYGIASGKFHAIFTKQQFGRKKSKKRSKKQKSYKK